jgi:hypothetical protein
LPFLTIFGKARDPHAAFSLTKSPATTPSPNIIFGRAPV